MSILTAHYDPATDRIIGCKPGTIPYYHEQGHRYWYKAGVESTLQLWEMFCIWTALMALAWEHNYIAKISLFIMVVFITISEVHAWIFAFDKWRKR